MNGSVNSGEDEITPLLSPVGDPFSRRISPRPRLSPEGQRSADITASRRKSADIRDGDRVLRQPVQYHSINTSINSASYDVDDDQTMAQISRYKYYNKLAPHSNSTLQMPDHVVPSQYVIVIPLLSKPDGGQNSIITIFSLWNTMMGTSLLSMPWAIRQAGFVNGIVLLIVMAGIMLYTSYRILKSLPGIEAKGDVLEFSDVCKHYLGRWAEILALVSSLLTLIGGMIVYWILISNFIYNVVSFIYDHVTDEEGNTSNSEEPVCKGYNSTPPGANYSNFTLHQFPHIHSGTFQKVWDVQKTVPLFLVIILLPLINIKSPTFFTKFNALGTVSVTYLTCFVAVYASKWGFHLDFSAPETSDNYIPEFKSTFPALTGIAALAYFVQNCVLSITRTNKHPENNVRDLIIAYILVAVTYIYMGCMFYAALPLPKDCIEDNLLNNIPDTNVMAFVARIGLFCQMCCVFPLLVFVFRMQFMNQMFGEVWPSWKHVLIMNIVLVAICIVFAVFLPHIGSIIGFVGAFCGFSYAILLPCFVYMKIRQQNGTLTWPVVIVHSALIVFGLANFIGQFLILGKTS